jgi:hypothetical protein
LEKPHHSQITHQPLVHPTKPLHEPTEFIPSDLQDLFALCRENPGGFDVYNSTVIALIERVSSLEHRLKRI